MTQSPTVSQPPTPEFTVSLVLAEKGGGRTEVLGTGTLGPTGIFELQAHDADAFERGLALMLTARFADLPLTEFARHAAAQMATNPASGSKLGPWATRPLLSLIAEKAAIANLGKRRETAIRRSFESQVQNYVVSLLEAIEDRGDADEEDRSEGWQPGAALAAERDRILRFGGPAPLTGREVVGFLGVTRATLANWRRNGRILGLPHGSERKLVYPRWQFDPKRPTHLLPGLAEVLAASKEREPWGVADLLTAPTPSLDGQRPIERLAQAGVGAAAQVSAVINAAYL